MKLIGSSLNPASGDVLYHRDQIFMALSSLDPRSNELALLSQILYETLYFYDELFYHYDKLLYYGNTSVSSSPKEKMLHHKKL